jgi:hypothetical protein
MSDNGVSRTPPTFGPTFRILVGGVAFLCGVVLWLWATDQGAVWKYFPSLFCFCIFGIVALPRPVALACGYLVALVVLALSVWFLYLGFTGKDPLLNAVRFSAVYGLPALAFLVYRQIPGTTRSTHTGSLSTQDTQLLRAAYAAFNERNIDAAVALMTDDVVWPKAFKGGFARGPAEIRAYWTEQWSEIDPRVEPVNFYPEGDGTVLVDVHQVVRDLAGSVLADIRVGHRFTIKGGLISAMEITGPPSPE